MRKLGFIISALALVLGLAQCAKKPVMPTCYIGVGEKQSITFSVNGGTKGVFDQVGDVLNYKWVASDLLYVYGIGSNGNGTGFAGTLTTSEEDITGSYSAKFKGVVTIPEGSAKLRFVHYGKDVEVEQSGAASIDLSSQDGSLESMSGKVIAVSDKTIEPSGAYVCEDLAVQFAAAKFDLSYFGKCDIEIAGVPQNAISVSENGDITCVDASSENTTLTGLTSASNAYYVAFATGSIAEKKEFELVLTGNNYYREKVVNLTSGVFYSDNAKSITIVPEYADLSLESGYMWASCNVYADRPENEGGHYQWASKEDYKKEISNWPDYYWGNGEYFNSENKDIFRKYHGGKEEYVAPDCCEMDYYTTIQQEDDIAKEVLKNGWEIPAMTDFYELVNGCYLIYTAAYHDSDKDGYIVYAAKDDSDKGLWTDANGITKRYGSDDQVDAPEGYSTDDTHIFMPLARGVTEVGGTPMRGVYWSVDMAEKDSGLYPESARCLWINLTKLVPDHYSYRYAAYTIRAINKEIGNK